MVGHAVEFTEQLERKAGQILKQYQPLSVRNEDPNDIFQMQLEDLMKHWGSHPLYKLKPRTR